MDDDADMGDNSQQLEAFTRSVGLGVPVSTILSIQALCKVTDLDGLIVIFQGLLSLCEDLMDARASNEQIERAIFDVIEFIVGCQDTLCTRDRGKLIVVRGLIVRFETLVSNSKKQLDYRMFSLFMENKIGETAIGAGPVCSEFNKIKSKLFRACELSWEERERVIEQLVSNVSDKRRGYLMEGRDEVRGYCDMSDKEIQGWATLASELSFSG